MNPNKSNLPDKKSKPAPEKPAAATAAAPPPSGKVPPLFRRIDWLALLVAFGVVWIVYFLTLAPELTLEDSGELCTGSFYAGIPHPPGYPFWAIYSWLWTLLPMGNVAWRVEVGEATAAAMACGFVALMVSRGSSMLMEGIEELRTLTKRWESAICVVSGISAGLLLGLGHTMWSESVAINRISLFGVPWVMAVLLCLLRWIYAPHQRRYLYWAMFFFGLCSTIHQTLMVAAFGIEAAVITTQPRLGRTFVLGNTLIFFAGLIAHLTHVTAALDTSNVLLAIFFTVGVGSIIGYFWLAIITKETVNEFILDAGLAGVFVFGALAVSYGFLFALLAIASVGVAFWGAFRTWKFNREWLVAIICLLLVMLGAAFYFYEPLAGMTNPPMEWGYPRTVDGFWHALSRGQYEKANPTDVFGDPSRFMSQLWFLVHGIADEYNWLLVFITLIPFFFYLKMQKRERSWLNCLVATYLSIGVLLVILMNPGADRQSVDLHRVFFASSHGVIAILFGYGFSLIAAYMAVYYQNFRKWGLIGAGIAVVFALYSLWDATGKHYFSIDGTVPITELPHWIAKAFGPNQGGLPIFGSLILVALPLIFLIALALYKTKAPLAVFLGLLLIMPVSSGLSHWAISEQRNHWFGYWFGHDMFTPPFGTYPVMAHNAILFGGTDPGRFAPTYMIFCESFIPHKDQPKEDQHFDRRDVYIITQNALADPTYLDYIRAQYFRSAEIDPPFFQELLRPKKEVDENYTTNFVARLAYEFLDKPFTKLGADIEARRRREGVYPPKEIYTPSPNDLSRCYSDYMADAQQRYTHDKMFPNEPRQIKAGEIPQEIPGENKVAISGETAVMSINGLLTKVIFDQNPTNEFYVEESFPLDWMFPYLSPYGVIMKINRQPLNEVTDKMVDDDHQFWTRYSDRLIGNWVNYDTPIKDIAAFVDRVYMQHDYTGFTGNRRFVRDDQAQKAFSKLRGSIGEIYDWRFRHAKNAAEQQRMYKEAEFAFRQAFAFCPYSQEIVFHYVNLVLSAGKLDDALLVAQICEKLDPNSIGSQQLVNQLTQMREKNGGAGAAAPSPAAVAQLQAEIAKDPNNFQAVFNLAAAYMQMQQKDKALQTLDLILTNSKADAGAMIFLSKAYAQLNDYSKLELSLHKLTTLEPGAPEVWCDLAAVETALNKKSEAIKDLQACVDENKARLARQPNAPNMLDAIRADPRLKSLHGMPEYEKLVSGK
jgi:tetratricopeptide (TPR) repeat protein